MDVFISFTRLHRWQRGMVRGPVVDVALDTKGQSLLSRALRFACLLLSLVTVHRRSRIYVPRCGTFEAMALMRLFPTRIVLTSDGLSDCLPTVSGRFAFMLGSRLGLQPVAMPFADLESWIPKRVLRFDPESTLVLGYSKYGYTPDRFLGAIQWGDRDWRRVRYVNGDGANEHTDPYALVVLFPSTLVFEISGMPRERVVVLRLSQVVETLEVKDRLAHYEKYLMGRGYRVIDLLAERGDVYQGTSAVNGNG